MQRTIKFRGKRTDNGEWVYGFGIVMDWFRNIYFIAKVGDPIVAHIDMVEVIEETIGQFTGLKDKNGKEIYEGDVVRYDDISDLGESLGEVAVVEYMDDQGCFDPLAIGYSGCYYSRYIENTEVIGNIHDNPELLK